MPVTLTRTVRPWGGTAFGDDGGRPSVQDGTRQV